MRDTVDSPYLPPVVALLDEYGSTVVTGRAPKPGPDFKYTNPVLRIFTAGGDGMRAQTIELNDLDAIEALGQVCISVFVHCTGPEQHAAAAIKELVPRFREQAMNKIYAMRNVLPQFGMINIDGGCMFELTGNGRGFSWQMAVDYIVDNTWALHTTEKVLRAFQEQWPTEKEGDEFLELCSLCGV